MLQGHSLNCSSGISQSSVGKQVIATGLNPLLVEFGSSAYTPGMNYSAVSMVFKLRRTTGLYIAVYCIAQA